MVLRCYSFSVRYSFTGGNGPYRRYRLFWSWTGALPVEVPTAVSGEIAKPELSVTTPLCRAIFHPKYDDFLQFSL
jgi:hypothetical protein